MMVNYNLALRTKVAKEDSIVETTILTNTIFSTTFVEHKQKSASLWIMSGQNFTSNHIDQSQ